MQMPGWVWGLIGFFGGAFAGMTLMACLMILEAEDREGPE